MYFLFPSQLASAGSTTFYVDDVYLQPSSLIVYADSLLTGWADYSWPVGAANFAATSPVHAGSNSIAVSVGQWQAVSLRANTALSSTTYSSVR